MNAIVPLEASEFQMLTQMAAYLVKSGFLPQAVNTPEKAVAIILAGRELGIQPWQSLTTINVIQGKPTVSPQLMLALIQRSGELEDIQIESDEAGCTVTMKRRGKTAFRETFTMQDAAALGLAGKDNYKRQPKVMLRWRAVTACARVVFPDVIMGLYTPDEMGAEVEVSDDGAMTVVVAPPPPAAESEAGTPRERAAQEQPAGERKDNGAKAVKAKDHWTRIKKAVAGYLEWAREQFDFDEAAVVRALLVATDDLLIAVEDWNGTKTLAMAALVAAFCEYEPARIEFFTSGMPGKDDDKFSLNEAAQAVAARFHDHYLPPAGFETLEQIVMKGATYDVDAQAARAARDAG